MDSERVKIYKIRQLKEAPATNSQQHMGRSKVQPSFYELQIATNNFTTNYHSFTNLYSHLNCVVLVAPFIIYR